MPPKVQLTLQMEAIGPPEPAWCNQCALPSAVKVPFVIYPPLRAVFEAVACPQCGAKRTDRVK